MVLSCTLFELFTLNNIVTLKAGLEVTQGDSNWCHLSFESLSAVSYSSSIVTMAESLTVYEIFSVKVYRDLENWVRGCSRSLKVAPFDKPCTTFYCSAIVNIAQSGTVCELLDVE